MSSWKAGKDAAGAKMVFLQELLPAPSTLIVLEADTKRSTSFPPANQEMLLIIDGEGVIN